MTPSTTVIPSSTTAARPRHPTALMHAPSGPLLPSALDHTTCLASAPPSHRAVGPADRLRGRGVAVRAWRPGPGTRRRGMRATGTVGANPESVRIPDRTVSPPGTTLRPSLHRPPGARTE